MKEFIRNTLLLNKHTCPWWLAYSWDHRLRNLVQSPDKIIKPYLNIGDKALDVGCGMGFFTLAMAEYVGESGRVFAVDVQQQMLDIMMKRAKRVGCADRIQPILNPVDSLSLPQPVDFMLHFWMLHEVNDTLSFLKSGLDAMKPGGRYLLVEPKIHVTRGIYTEEIALCEKVGFVPIEQPDVSFSRAILFQKPAIR